MSEMILPGVYIEVRPEALISAGQISVGNIGIVGTARKGPVNAVRLLSSPAQAREIFGSADAWDDPSTPGAPLTLLRALQLAYDNGARNVYAVRVQAAGAPARTAAFALRQGGTLASTLRATSPGSWGNDIEANVVAANAPAVVTNEEHPGGGAITLGRPVANDARTRVRVFRESTGQTQVLTPIFAGAPAVGQVSIDLVTRGLTFEASQVPGDPDDRVWVTYVVPAANARRLTLRSGPTTETYLFADGAHLEQLLNAVNGAGGSALATADPTGATGTAVPDAFASATDFRGFGRGADTPGSDGAAAADADYGAGLELLLNEDAHIIVAAGMDAAGVADELLAHVQNASTDKMRRDRIAVVGSAVNATAAQIAGHSVASDRVVYVGPGVRVTDAATSRKVVLPGAYTAAAVAGMLSARPPHVSLTNKVLAGVETVEPRFTPPELELLVQARVLAVESRNGIRVVKGITTDDGAFKQITTRRIVDYAKFGVRSAAQPFIGLLNNDRVRKSLQGAINGFLAGMVDDEMLTGYELAVTATRDEEIRGIARVTMTVKPTFSIDFIKVTMFLG